MLTETQERTLRDVVLPTTDQYPPIPPYRFGETHSVLVTGGPRREDIDTDSNKQYALEDYSDLIGRVITARVGRHEPYWFSENRHAYVKGTVVNPEPVNGRFYREYTANLTATPAPFILRYNDDEHNEDRFEPHNPWTIVAADPRLSTVVPTGRVVPPTFYVEVLDPALATETPALNLDEVFENPMPGTIGNAVSDHTMGKAHVEDDGTVLLNPPMEQGVMYLMWTNHASYENTTAVRQAGSGTTGVEAGLRETHSIGAIVRSFAWNDDQARIRFSSDLYSPNFSNPGEREIKWAKLAWPEVAKADAEVEAEMIGVLQEKLIAEHEAFEDINDALNDFAEEQGWCPEYERAVEPHGLRGRNQDRAPYGEEPRLREREYRVSVTVDFNGEVESAGSNLENALGSAANAYGASIRNVTFDASYTVSFMMTGISEDDVRDRVDSGDIENALDNEGVSYTSLNDWSIDEVEEEED